MSSDSLLVCVEHIHHLHQITCKSGPTGNFRWYATTAFITLWGLIGSRRR